jgi:CRP-like cAMP-binding protein
MGSPRRTQPADRRSPTRAEQPSPDAARDWAGVRTNRTQYARNAVIFDQGDSATSVGFVTTGTVRMSVLSQAGKERVVGIVYAGDFFGEGCLAGQPLRTATATTMTPSTVLTVEKAEMMRQLRSHPEFAARFRTHVLARNIRMEEDLIDHVFNSTEKRLARALLLLGRRAESTTHVAVPKLSQTLLADMVGTTRSRVNLFMNKFRTLGFIAYDDSLRVNDELLSAVLRD